MADTRKETIKKTFSFLLDFMCQIAHYLSKGYKCSDAEFLKKLLVQCARCFQYMSEKFSIFDQYVFYRPY